MERATSRHRRIEASKLSVVLLVTLVASLALLALLQILPKPTYPIASSEAWNACLPYVETAIEEALSHHSFNSSNMAARGWTMISTNRYLKTNAVTGGGYVVTMSASQPYDILGTGYVQVAGTSKIVQRAVKVTAFDMPVFRFAVLAQDRLNLKGNNVRIDSFDSRDPIGSPSGLYVAANARDRADVVCLSGKTGAFDIGNGDIWGCALTGSGGSVIHGPDGTIGSKIWQQNDRSGIEPGWSRSNLNLSIPEVTPPFVAGAPPGGAGTIVDGTTYDQVFDNGNFMMSSLTGKSLVTGLAVVYVTGEIRTDLITVQTNAYLQLYGGGASTRLNCVNNESKQASHLIYFGLPTNASLSLNNDWIGVVCAPDCDLSAMDGREICGAICVKSLTLRGNCKLHYDEALGATTNRAHAVITSWSQL